MSLPAITAAGTVAIPIDAGSDVSLSTALTDADGNAVDLLDATGGTLYVHEGWDERRTIDPPAIGSYPVTISAPATGVMVLTLTAAETAAMQTLLAARQRTVTDRTVSTYAYELEITDGSSVVRVLNGPLTLSRRGTR